MGRNSGPFMHALHFFYGIGAFVSPLIVKPFLDETPCRPVHSLAHDASLPMPTVGAEAMALADASVVVENVTYHVRKENDDDGVILEKVIGCRDEHGWRLHGRI